MNSHVSRVVDNPTQATIYNRHWVLKNPEKAEEVRRRSLKRKAAKAAVKKVQWRGQMPRKQEILSLHARGKDNATIAIRMGIAMSKVAEVIAQNQPQ